MYVWLLINSCVQKSGVSCLGEKELAEISPKLLAPCKQYLKKKKNKKKSDVSEQTFARRSNNALHPEFIATLKEEEPLF